MIYNLTLADDSVVFMDDSTGNIAINLSNCPECNQDDTILIHYEEDSQNVNHKYTVSSVDTENNVINLVWEEMIKDTTLNESPEIKLSGDDLNDPSSIDLKGKVQAAIEQEKAEAEAAEKEKKHQEMMEQNKELVDLLHSTEDKSELLDKLFDKLVPGSGPAETVAGEYVRAIVRMMYRDLNDGDKFFTGYGIETCGGSAEYLYDQGFTKTISLILDRAYELADNDSAYTAALGKLGEEIVNKIIEQPELLWTENTEDSRDYSADYIEENQPRYEYELYGSDDIDTLVEKGIINAWDLNSFVEQYLSYFSELNDAEVERPWSHNSTTVTVSNLTRDGYDVLQDNFTHDTDAFWGDLVGEYEDELNSDDTEDDDDESEEDLDDEF